MASSLQEQLLKAGLAKKARVNEVLHKQAKQRKGKPQARDAGRPNSARAQLPGAERDRALAAEKNARAKAKEQRAQARQIIEAHRVKREGEIEYAFAHHGKVRRILVDTAQRVQLISGALLIVRLGPRYELVPRAAGLKLRERDPSLVVLDHADAAPTASADSPVADADAEYYRQFEVPDDLTW
jgi:uncharacterized protein YaiL (DUF2058 family)